MCETAGEIQKIKEHVYEEGDYCHCKCKECGTWIHCEGKLYDFDGIIWLPRQDQLQEMVANCKDHNGKYGKGAYLLRVFVEWMPTSKGNESGSSLEHLWLAFVMHEKYQKQWSDEKEIWQK